MIPIVLLYNFVNTTLLHTKKQKQYLTKTSDGFSLDSFLSFFNIFGTKSKNSSLYEDNSNSSSSENQSPPDENRICFKENEPKEIVFGENCILKCNLLRKRVFEDKKDECEESEPLTFAPYLTLPPPNSSNEQTPENSSEEEKSNSDKEIRHSDSEQNLGDNEINDSGIDFSMNEPKCTNESDATEELLSEESNFREYLANFFILCVIGASIFFLFM